MLRVASTLDAREWHFDTVAGEETSQGEMCRRAVPSVVIIPGLRCGYMRPLL